jgi:hypothetical protein
MPARLTVFYSDSPARHFYLDENRDYVIGRGGDCDLRLEDRRLSRRHAALRCRQGGYKLEDLGSKNGIRIGGRTVRSFELGETEWISFGGLVTSFDIVSARLRLAEERRAAERWESSVELRRRLDPADAVERLLESLLESVLTLSAADRGYVLLHSADGDLRVVGGGGQGETSFSPGDFQGSSGAVALASAELRPVVTCDASEDALLAHRPSVATGAIRALVCLPLAVGDKVIGVIYADSRTPGKVFSELDIELLLALANHAALVIGVSSLRRDIAGLAELLPAGFEPGTREHAELAALLHERLPGRPRRFSETLLDEDHDRHTAVRPDDNGRVH